MLRLSKCQATVLFILENLIAHQKTITQFLILVHVVKKKEYRKMDCLNVEECTCPKKECPNNGKCCACVIKHRNSDSLPFCLFLDNNGDKSIQNYYLKLKERFD